MSSQQQAIRDFCEERGVWEVVHFTHSDNLPTILSMGLLSIRELKARKIDYRFNDQQRIEGRDDAICLSISFPNYRMFYKYRQNSNLFVVISIAPRILWELDCYFCPTNAANTEVLKLMRFSPSSLRGLAAIQRMFAESRPYRDKTIQRSDLGIPSHYTTDPQAEVLCFQPIASDYIQAIYHLGYPEVIAKVPNEFQPLVQNAGSYFSPRQDYEHWR